ncbi:MAG: hypothetical protein KC413_15700, partial [Anaerolineales bacterium]|nr:hypothetical protein [Anaerolineales bacterium]
TSIPSPAKPTASPAATAAPAVQRSPQPAPHPLPVPEPQTNVAQAAPPLNFPAARPTNAAAQIQRAIAQAETPPFAAPPATPAPHSLPAASPRFAEADYAVPTPPSIARETAVAPAASPSSPPLTWADNAVTTTKTPPPTLQRSPDTQAAPAQRAQINQEVETAVATNPPTATETAAAPELDMDELAQRVYSDLQRRFSVEWERARGRLG